MSSLNRESVIEWVRRRVVLEAVSRVHLEGEALVVRGDLCAGTLFLANGEGDHHVLAWSLDGVVAFAFDHDADEGQHNLAPGDRTPETFVPGAPEALAGLVAAAADACARLATGGAWVHGGTGRSEGTTDALDGYLANGGALPRAWIALAGLGEAQAHLAQDLAERSQDCRLTLGPADVAALMAPPTGTACATVQSAERAAGLLAWAGITWLEPAAAAQAAMTAAAGRLADQLGPLGSDLFAASFEGRLADVSDLLQRGADVGLVFPASRPGQVMPGETPLVVAARRGHADVAARLLAAGAAPDAGHGWRALDWAAHRGDAALVRVLLAAGADVKRGTDHWPPLQHALAGRSAEVVRQLLDAGAQLPPPSWCERLADMLRAQGAEDLAARVTRPAPAWWAPLCSASEWRPRPGTMIRPEVPGTCTGALARADEALALGHGHAALDALREHWGASRHPRVADAIDRLSARLGHHPAWPNDHQRLDEAATLRWLDDVADEPADPRQTRAIATFLQRGHFFSPKDVVARCVERAAEALVHLLDVRYVAALAELPSLGRESTHWVHALNGVPAPLVAARRELEAFIPPALDEADATTLSLVEDRLADRRPAPRGSVAVHDLLHDVWAHPDDDGPRRRLAERLASAGDPRGEFITLQLTRAGTAKKPTKRERDLLAEHGRAWAGRIAWVLASCDFERGFPARVSTGHPSLKPGEQTYEHPRLPDGVGTQDEWSTITHLSLWRQTHGTGGLLRSPKLRVLRHVADVERDVVDLLDGPPLPWESLGLRRQLEPAQLLALSRTLPALRQLTAPLGAPAPERLVELVAAFEHLRHLAVTDLPARVGELAAAFERRGLETLRVLGGWVEVGFDFRSRSAEVRLPGRLHPSLDAIAARAIGSLADAKPRAVTVVAPRRAKAEGSLPGTDVPGSFVRGRERMPLGAIASTAGSLGLRVQVTAWQPASWSPVPEGLGTP